MASDTPSKALTKPQGRSRVTNGSLGAMDGRSKWARRFRDVIAALSDDLGGADDLPEMKRSLVRRAAALTVELERAEEGFAKAGEADPDALKDYQVTVGQLRRTLETLGLHKHSHSIPPEVERRMEGGRMVRQFTESMSREDRGIAYGRDEKHLARAIAYMITKAVRDGTELPALIAKIAEDIRAAQIIDAEPVADPVAEPEDMPDEAA